MRSILKKFLVIIAVIYLITINKISMGSDALTFENVLNKALESSFDLKTSSINIDISKSVIDKAKSDYFPLVKTGLYSEYIQDLSKNNQTEAIGNNIITTDSKIQNMISTSVTYNLFDFGQRKRRLLIAKEDMEAKQAQYLIKKRDLELKIVDLYTNALILYKEMVLKEQIEDIYRQISRIKEEKSDSGETTKIDSIDSSIDAAKVGNEVVNLRLKFAGALRELSYYTNEDYNADIASLSDFEERVALPVSDKNPTKDKNTLQISVEKKDAVKPEEINLNFKYTPDYKTYQSKIDKKNKELEILKRERLPKVDVYVNYRLYGKDTTDVISSFQNFQNKNLALGFATTFIPFDGFKNAADKKRAKLEIKKLENERNQAISELKNKYKKLVEEAAYYQRSYDSNKRLLLLLGSKFNELKKLEETNPENMESILNEQIKILTQQLEAEKILIKRASALKKNEIFIQEIE